MPSAAARRLKSKRKGFSIISKTLYKSDSSLIRRWCLGWIPFWIYSFLVFESAVVPLGEVPGFLARFIFRFDDQFLHAAEYFLLFLFSVNAFRRAKSLRLRSLAYGCALLYCALMGLATEAAQFYAPGRSAAFVDWSADIAGAFVAFCLWRRFSPHPDSFPSGERAGVRGGPV